MRRELHNPFTGETINVDGGSNCGIGPGGFQPGNTCAKGSVKGGRPSAPERELGAVKLRPTMEDRALQYDDTMVREARARGTFDSAGVQEARAALFSQGHDKVVLNDYSGGGVAGAVSFRLDDDGSFYIDHLGSTGIVKGTGTELLRYVVDRAVKKDAGIKFSASNMAEGFWRKHGFEGPQNQMSMSAARVKELKRRLGSPGRSSKK